MCRVTIGRMETIHEVPKTGITYPDVTIAGKKYQLKFTLASQILLQRWGLPWVGVFEWLREEMKAGRTQEGILNLIASMLGSTVNGDWVPLGVAPLILAGKMTGDEWTAILNVFNEALEKAQPTAETPEAIPANTTQPVQ